MSELLARARRGEPLTGADIIDMHGHLGRWQFAIPDTSAEGLVATMDRLGVRTVVCSHMSCMHGRVARGNRAVARAVRDHPGRIEGYATLWPSSPGDVRTEALRCFEAGFVGVKLHNINGFDYTDEAYAPALAEADARRMPVLLHTWGKQEEFRQVRQLSETYPQTSILLAHAAASSKDEYVRVARDCPNVYLDTCLSAAPRGLIAELAAGAGAGKLVWGSDAVFLSMPQQLGRVLAADIAEPDRLAILSGNARRILGRVRR